MTQAPLPTWRSIAGALSGRRLAPRELAAPWCAEDEIAGWLSRSAWSLALVALWRGKAKPGTPVTVWIPDFFCNGPLAPLRHCDTRLVFYPVDANMAPDMAGCRLLLQDTPPDVFVLVHYFGRPTPAAAIRDFCTRAGAWLVEDAAHVLRPMEGVGVYGDFVLYSPHKHLPIPNGAVLVARARGPGKLTPETLGAFGAPEGWSDQLQNLQRELGVSQSAARKQTLLWLIKRTLQKLGVRRDPPAVEFAEVEAKPVSQPGEVVDAAAVSSVSLRLLRGLSNGLDEVARIRIRNERVWDELLLNPSATESLPVSAAERPSNPTWTPYLASYVGEAAQKTYARLLDRALPVTTWPDLPPEVIADRQRHSRAWELRHTRLYLPVHQSWSPSRLLAAVGPVASAPAATAVRLEWDRATAHQWHSWLIEAGKSNLLQSWAYGAAKAASSGWQVRRGVFYLNGEPIALLQLLYRRVAGVFTVMRINRGPISLRELQPQEQESLWQQVAALGNWRRGRVLIAAPEARATGRSLAQLARHGLRGLSGHSTESVWIDLSLDTQSLRKQLDGKWRNMLAAAEKAGLEVQAGSEAGLFDWMLDRYRELMLEKNFAGPPLPLLLALRAQLEDESHLVVLRALSAGEPVGGVCLAIHGAAATYLLGWTSPAGRSLKANQFLLWQAVLYLQQRGLRWLDLGGIDALRTPGITAFKLGMNGERYELVGEYVKW